MTGFRNPLKADRIVLLYCNCCKSQTQYKLFFTTDFDLTKLKSAF